MLVRGSSAINMFSNSKKSEIDPRGGVSIFQISLEFKKSEISYRGGGSSLFGKKSAIFPFFNYDASPKPKYAFYPYLPWGMEAESALSNRYC